MFLDPQEGFKIHFRRFIFSVPCHIGPTGALRIPICHFTTTQFNHLCNSHDQLQKSSSEFEVLKTESPEHDHTEEPSRPKQQPGNRPISVFSPENDGVRPQADHHQGALAAWFRMMMKILFTMSRVRELARRFLRPQAPAATENICYGNPSSSGSKTS